MYSLEYVASYAVVGLSLFSLSGAWAFHVFVFVIAGLAAMAMLVGWHSRWAAAASCVLTLSLHLRESALLDVGDSLIGYLLLWSTLLPLGARWSLDARSRGEGPSYAYSEATEDNDPSRQWLAPSVGAPRRASVRPTRESGASG